MVENHVFVGVMAGDRSWRAGWESVTGNDPHLVAKMARDVAAIASTAAHGQWGAEAVRDAMAKVSREYPTLAPVEFEDFPPVLNMDPPVPEPVAIMAPDDPDADGAGKIALNPSDGDQNG